MINLISKPEVFENDFEGDGRRFYTDGRHVHRFLQELVRDTGIGDMITVGKFPPPPWNRPCATPTRPNGN